MCIDDQTPFYSFVTIDGIAEIISNVKIDELFKWPKIIAARYMGNDKVEEYGKEIVQKKTNH